jgi:chemotaxis protein CheD
MELPKVNVQPGELYLAREPAILQTILGSCVSVTFWSPRLGAGALCHGVLPRSPRGAIAPEGHHYVDFVIHHLVRKFDEMGALRSEVEVKVFGGADVLPVGPSRTGRPTVGALNCQVALEVLEEEGFAVLASDLGGTRGRTIRFHTATGEVLVHRLEKLGARPRNNADAATPAAGDRAWV